MKESQLQSKVMQYLKSQGAWAVKVQSASRGGTPDVLGCFKGLFFAIELKSPELKKVEGSALQKHQESLIRQSGGAYLITNSLDEVQNFLTNL